MISIIPERRKDGKTSFKSAVDYALGISKHREEYVLHVGTRNLFLPESAVMEMEALASDNTRCKDPVFHFILSWRENEVPTPEQADQAAAIALEELDLQDCQAVWGLQADTDNIHLHVVANRIHPETRRAVQPNGNWTKKGLEAASRKIEIIQGWEVETSGHLFEVTNEREVVAKPREAEPKEKSSQKAKNMEAHTGQKSAEQIAKEQAGEVLRTAQSWAELHERLNARGISFERKGGGAVLNVQGVFVKLSKVDRSCSFSKLVSRLGEFQERPLEQNQSDEESLKSPQPEPTDRVKRHQDVKKAWEEYLRQKEDHKVRQEKARVKLKEEQSEAWKALKVSQKKERDELWRSQNWRGRGAELNQRRSILAAKQAGEKLELRERQQRQREKLKRTRRHFPSFKEWLKMQEDEELARKYRYGEETPIFTSWDSKNQNSERVVADIRDYKAKILDNRVAWCRAKSPGKADFVDHGRRIVMDQEYDETAVLAAMQLAAQKWGKVKINGTDERYRQLCVKVAAEHNIRLSNEDLAAQVKERKEAMNMQREETWAKERAARRTAYESRVYGRPEFDRYAQAVGAESYRITVTETRESGTRAFVFDRKNGGEWKTADDIRKNLWKLKRYADWGRNVIIWPKSKDKHHIVVDDLTAEKLKQLRNDGYRPACVIESSPGNFQAILTVPSLRGDTSRDREEANRLAKILNEKYGDPKFSGSLHGHRLPPFGNYKPKHRRSDGTYPETHLIEAEGGMCRKAWEQLQGIAHEREQQRIEAERRAKEMQAQRMAQQKTAAGGANVGGEGPCDPDGAYWKHYEDISKRWRGDDWSQLDGMIAIRMRVTGYSPSQVQSALENNAQAMRHQNMSDEEFQRRYRYRNWRKYAQETTDNFAFGARGVRQYRDAEAYKPFFLKVEGRTEDLKIEMAQKKVQDSGWGR